MLTAQGHPRTSTFRLFNKNEWIINVAMTTALCLYLCPCLSVSLCLCLSLCACDSLPVSPSLSVSLCVPVRLSVCLSICLSLAACDSVCLFFLFFCRRRVALILKLSSLSFSLAPPPPQTLSSFSSLLR